MTATVLQFRRKPVKGLRERGIPANANLYYCVSCSSDVFRFVSDDGSVYCAAPSCGKFITNIRVTK